MKNYRVRISPLSLVKLWLLLIFVLAVVSIVVESQRPMPARLEKCP